MTPEPVRFVQSEKMKNQRKGFVNITMTFNQVDEYTFECIIGHTIYTVSFINSEIIMDITYASVEDKPIGKTFTLDQINEYNYTDIDGNPLDIRTQWYRYRNLSIQYRGVRNNDIPTSI